MNPSFPLLRSPRSAGAAGNPADFAQAGFAANGVARSRSAEKKLTAALEVLFSLAVVALGALGFEAGWLPSNGAAVVTLLLLVALNALAWVRFDGGRHPAFFFLCLLTLFQAGRLIAYCLGGLGEIFRVTLMTSCQFGVGREVEGRVLVVIVLSAIAIYAPCRWYYRPFSRLESRRWARFLPYLYLLFWMSVPIQLYKNYRYYDYARSHGGYLVFFIDHGGMAASVPAAIRAISLISLPAIVGVFVLEPRRQRRRSAAAVYFAVTAPVLLTGSRGAVFSLILSLWYLSKVKSSRRTPVLALALVAAAMVGVGALIGSMRVENGETRGFAGPAQFLADQGASFNVTEVAIAYRARFAPHIGAYLANELQSAFVATDQSNAVAGQRFADDVAMFLNPETYRLGFGSGSAYVAEAFVAGGLGGVVTVSLLLGLLLHGLHLGSRHPLGLFLATMILPDLLWMARGGLLDWASAVARVALSLTLLIPGWWLYCGIARMMSVWRSGEKGNDEKGKRNMYERATADPQAAGGGA